MPATTFRTRELDFLQPYREKWRKLKEDPDLRPHIKGRLKPRTQFIRDLVDAFYSAFPDRDNLLSDENEHTFDDEQRRRFPERVRTWLNNNTRTPGGLEAQRIQKQKSKVTARQLVQQTFKPQINAIHKDILVEQPTLNSMTAYNHAVTRQIQHLKENDAAEWSRIEALAEEIRCAAQSDFASLSPEALTRLLGSFPIKLLNHITEWSRSLPVHIYCVTLFSTPDDPALKSYTVLSPTLSSIEGSSAGEQMRDTLLCWMEDNLGAQASRRSDTAAATVYPDRDGGLRPMLPEADDVSMLERLVMSSRLRLYFNYLYKWLGGKGGVPWLRMSKDVNGTYVDPDRMPDEYPMLSDPHDWTRSRLEAVYSYILRGQRKELPSHKMFQFHQVDCGSSQAPLIYSELRVVRPEECQLTWGPDEKLYAIRLAANGEEAPLKRSWKGLPLCRTTLIYEPLSGTLTSALRELSTSEIDLNTLISLLKDQERCGAIHTHDTMSKGLLNALLPSDLHDDVLRRFTAEWLPVPFFDEGHPEYPKYALSTFINWVQAPNRFRHDPSATWRGGPLGVRWVVVAVARIHTNLTLIELSDYVPDELMSAIDASIILRQRRMLQSFCAWLIISLKDSIRVLNATRKERANAWKAAVVVAHLTGQDTPQALSHDAHQTVSSGVPTLQTELQECYETLTQTNPEMTLGNDLDNITLLQRISRTAGPSFLRDDEDEAEFSGDSEQSEVFDLGDDESSSSEGSLAAESVSSCDVGLNGPVSPAIQEAAGIQALSAEERVLPTGVEEASLLDYVTEQPLDASGSSSEEDITSTDHILGGMNLWVDSDNLGARDSNTATSCDEVQQMDDPIPFPAPISTAQQESPKDPEDNVPTDRSGPLAVRQLRRSTVCNPRVEAAIQTAKKGSYKR